LGFELKADLPIAYSSVLVRFRFFLKRIYNSLNLICMEGMSSIKNQLLALLDQDEEFRLAVATKLGIMVINQKLDKILETKRSCGRTWRSFD
jgi:hypothetical protein